MRAIPESMERLGAEIAATVAAFPDTDSKWSWLLKLAKAHPAMADEYRNEKFLVRGCATRLYLAPVFEDGRLWFETDTDAGDASPLIVRGLADLAQRLYSGQRPSDILAFDPEFFRKTGIHGALSATRANGFASLLRQIRLYAEAYARLEALGEARK